MNPTSTFASRLIAWSLLLILFSCDHKDPTPKIPPVVETLPVVEIGETSAVISGAVVSKGSDNGCCQIRGLFWGKEGVIESTINDTHEGAAPFAYKIYDLKPATRYSYRAFVTTRDGADEGETITFETLPVDSAKRARLAELRGIWKMFDVTRNGVSAKDSHADFTLALKGTEGEYSFYFDAVRPYGSPWPAEGRWMFGTDINTRILRNHGFDDKTTMMYSLSDGHLVLSFTFTGGYGGADASGDWVFTLVR